MLNERMSAAKKIASDLHQAEDAIDDTMISIARLAATLPTARRDTNMSAMPRWRICRSPKRRKFKSGGGRTTCGP